MASARLGYEVFYREIIPMVMILGILPSSREEEFVLVGAYSVVTVPQ
jgi:hypothetical protein